MASISESEIIKLLQTSSPFSRVPIISSRDIWKGHDWLDLECFNAHASDIVLKAIDEVAQGKHNVLSILITASISTGKSHLISRLHRQIKTQKNCLFILIDDIDSFDSSYRSLQRVIAYSLSEESSLPGINQWQELAAEIFNTVWKTSKLGYQTPEDIIHIFNHRISEDKVEASIRKTTEKYCEINNNIADANIIQAVLWTLLNDQERYAIKWLKGDDLPEYKADELNISKCNDDSSTVLQILRLASSHKTLAIFLDTLDRIYCTEKNGSFRVLEIIEILGDLLQEIQNSVMVNFIDPIHWNIIKNQISPENCKKLTTYGDPIKLELLNEELCIDLLQLYLDDFYQQNNIDPPYKLYPFIEKEVREIGRSSPSPRQFLSWCRQYITSFTEEYENTIIEVVFLSFLDVGKSGKGLSTAIITQAPVEQGKTFFLYPHTPQKLGAEDCKHLPSLDALNTPITAEPSETLLIRYCAKCEAVDHLHDLADIQALALEQHWSLNSLQDIHKSRGNRLFGSGSLAVARVQVYQLPQPIAVKAIEKPKLGKFSGLRPLKLDPQLKVENLTPVVVSPHLIPSDRWIKTIADLGNRAKEDQPKSSYQAGTDFENVTAKALDFLGFKIEESYHGGAGGLDLYCSAPYPLVVECKSGKSIPTNTCQELINLTVKHLGKNKLVESKQLIIGPGEPTKDVRQSAIQSEISIMKPETLQKLAELQAQYPGAIDLFKFKEHLKAGQIDEEIQTFIDRIQQEIAIRRSIITIVKDNPNDANPSSIRIYYKTTYKPYPNLPDLTEQEIRDILIELSSPLTGYLGREAGNGSSDRFYFRKDLP